MQATRVQVIHVEDDLMERLIIRRFLSSIPEFNFVIHSVGSEDAALASCAEIDPDLVILDYYLRQGHGSSCLSRLRGLDPQVPILCLSGALNANRCAELRKLGASDCLDKLDLDMRVFARSVRSALARSRVAPQQVLLGGLERASI